MLDGIDANGLMFNATGHVISPRAASRVRSALLFEILRRLTKAKLPLLSPPNMVLKESVSSATACAGTSASRAEALRVGKEVVRSWRYRWAPSNLKKHNLSK